MGGDKKIRYDGNEIKIIINYLFYYGNNKWVGSEVLDIKHINCD